MRKMKKLGKFNLKSFVLGIVVTLLITTMCISALASGVSKTITAYYNNIKIYVDDSLVTPTDADGNVVEPFVYNGTTYLPVRAVASALGKAVSWDAATSSVYVGKHESTTPSIYLSQLDPITSENASVAGVSKDNMGNTYSDSIMLKGLTSANAEYVLNGGYTRIKGVFALPYTAKDHGTIGILKIYGDDQLLYTSPEMTKGVEPIQFDVDITGINRLRIEKSLDLNGDLSHGWTSYILNAGLYQ